MLEGKAEATVERVAKSVKAERAVKAVTSRGIDSEVKGVKEEDLSSVASKCRTDHPTNHMRINTSQGQC